MTSATTPSQLTLHVKPRGKPIRGLPPDVTVALGDKTATIYHELATKSGFSIHRLRVTIGNDGSSFVPNSDEINIKEAGLEDRRQIFVKDLGPQISWRTVYIIEYLGPLFIHPLIYFSRLAQPSSTQALILALIIVHFLKREYETIYVHRFSNATMPARNIFKNSFHYWILSGLMLAFFIYSPSAYAAQASKPLFTYIGLILFVFGELANLNAHIILRNLRAPGTTERGIPSGFGFSWVSCPNYMFETIAWLGILLLSRSWASVIFIVVAVLQMSAWAKKKEARYRREFKDTYKFKRFGVLPGIC